MAQKTPTTDPYVDFRTPPSTFTDEEKARWEVLETHLKARELMKPEMRRVATWTAIVSMAATLITISLTFAASGFQRTKSEADLSAKNAELKNNELLLTQKSQELEKAEVALQQKEKDLAVREARVKLAEAQSSSREAAYQALAAQYRDLQGRVTELARANRGQPVAQEVSKIASNMAQTVQDNTAVTNAFEKSTLTPSSIGSSGRQEVAIKTAVAGLFTTTKSQRLKAYDVLVGNLLASASTIPTLLDYASGHLSNGDGVANALEVVRLSERRLLVENRDEVKAFLNRVEASPSSKYPIVQRRVRLIRDRLSRAQLE